MGYCYDARTGRLACDSCGAAEGETRKRTCTARVTHVDSTGQRVALPYCPPPALCPACYSKHGGAKIHDACHEPARRRQAEEDRRAAKMATGAKLRRAAWGLDAGMVGVLFEGPGGALHLAMPEALYDAGGGAFGDDLSPEEYAQLASARGLAAPVPWGGPEHPERFARPVGLVAPASAPIERDLIPGTFPAGRLFPE